MPGTSTTSGLPAVPSALRAPTTCGSRLFNVDLGGAASSGAGTGLGSTRNISTQAGPRARHKNPPGPHPSPGPKNNGAKQETITTADTTRSPVSNINGAISERHTLNRRISGTASDSTRPTSRERVRNALSEVSTDEGDCTSASAALSSGTAASTTTNQIVDRQ